MKEREVYCPPIVLEVAKVVLEQDLLGGSVLYSTFVEIAGQQTDGYYMESDIVTSDNYWGD